MEDEGAVGVCCDLVDPAEDFLEELVREVVVVRVELNEVLDD